MAGDLVERDEMERVNRKLILAWMGGMEVKSDSNDHLMISGVKSLFLRVLEDMGAEGSSRTFGAGIIKKGSYQDGPIELRT